MLEYLPTKVNSMPTTVRYLGSKYKLPDLEDLKLYTDGDIISVGAKEYIYDDEEWWQLETVDVSTSSQQWVTKTVSMQMQPQICKCCGGRLDHSSTCMYCGVRYK